MSAGLDRSGGFLSNNVGAHKAVEPTTREQNTRAISRAIDSCGLAGAHEVAQYLFGAMSETRVSSDGKRIHPRTKGIA